MELGQKIGRVWQSFKREARDFTRGYLDEEVELNTQVLSGKAASEVLEGFRNWEMRNLGLKLMMGPTYDPLTGIVLPSIVRLENELDELKNPDDLDQTLKNRARRNLQMWGKLPNDN